MDISRRTVITTCFVVLVCVLLVSSQAVALYFDADDSSLNTVEGGVLDLKLSELGPATQSSTTDEALVDSATDTWEAPNHATDGSESVSNVLNLNNSQSSLAADRINLTVSFVENDDTLGSAGNAPNTSRTVKVAEFSYAETDLLNSSIADENGNGRIDVEDLTLGETATNLSSLSGIAANESKALAVTFSGRAALLGGVGTDDGIDITVTIRSDAVSFRDVDETTNNTIRYG